MRNGMFLFAGLSAGNARAVCCGLPNHCDNMQPSFYDDRNRGCLKSQFKRKERKEAAGNARCASPVLIPLRTLRKFPANFAVKKCPFWDSAGCRSGTGIDVDVRNLMTSCYLGSA
jgi:hypothetical protein